MKSRVTAGAGAVAAIALIAGCSSTAGSPAKPAAKASAAPASGTETMTGKVAGAAAVADDAVFPLALSGPVQTTGTFTTPSSTSAHATVTFKTKAGNLVAAAYSPDANGNQPPVIVNAAECRMQFTIHATYTVTGSESTGAFEGARGSGKALVVFQADAPKLANGRCNTSGNAQPVASTATGTFSASGPLTLK